MNPKKKPYLIHPQTTTKRYFMKEKINIIKGTEDDTFLMFLLFLFARSNLKIFIF